MFRRNLTKKYRKEINKRIDETMLEKRKLLVQMQRESLEAGRFSLDSKMSLRSLNDRLKLLNDIKESVEKR